VSTVQQHAQFIATTAGDYRRNDLGPLTANHVMTWIEQFDDEDRLPVLAELDHVLRKTYFSEAAVTDFLESLAKEPKLVGDDPAKFWKRAGILDIQQGGSSQAEMLERFDTVLQQQIGISIHDCESSSGNFIYVDDAIFTGNRFRRDLEPWIANAAPQKATVHVIVNALHTGSYYAKQQVDKAAQAAGKAITTMRWKVREVENRKYYRNQSEVLWPAEFPEGDADEISAYVQMLKDAGYPPEKRATGGTPKDGVFSGEAGRGALERAFLKAGVRIRSMCPYLKETARPLGYSKLMTLGFGATVVTYRNCPNNCPLALWAGDPWYPLFRRKTN
jgi:hypothetical protein